MFYNSEINIYQVIPPFGLRKYILNNKSGDNSKLISALDLKLHKLIHCLKLTSYNVNLKLTLTKLSHLLDF